MNKIKEIDDICKRYNIKNYVINKDGKVDVNGDVKIWGVDFKILPLKFNIINGNCDISNNKLITLKGSPVYVDGFFHCAYNELTNLKYSPKEVKEEFVCDNNKIKTLKHGPEKVNGSYYCYRNHLISLKYSPKSVNGKFDCSINNLVNLKYSPKEIKGDFDCSDNKLKTLEYGPERVYGGYFCSNNKLKNLKGCAKYIGGVLYVNNNPDLYTTEGLMCCEPKDIECKNTIFYNVWRLFQDVSKIELFNDMDIIREDDEGKSVIILNRLNEFLDVVGKPRVKHVDGYIII